MDFFSLVKVSLIKNWRSRHYRVATLFLILHVSLCSSSTVKFHKILNWKTPSVKDSCWRNRVINYCLNARQCCPAPKWSLSLMSCGAAQSDHGEFPFLIFLSHFIVVQLQLSAFSPHSPPHPSQTHLPPCFHPPPWFCPCVPYSSSLKPFSPLSPISGYFWIVLNFNVFGYILFAFFFCWLCSN